MMGMMSQMAQPRPPMPGAGQQMPAMDYPPPTAGGGAPSPQGQEMMRRLMLQMMQRGQPMSRPMPVQ